MTRFLLLAFALIWPAVAAAQGTSLNFGLLEQDTSLPVEVTADSLSVEGDDGRALFEGNVVVIQGEMRIAAQRIRISYGENAEGERTDITEMEATGGVTFSNGEDAAEATEAIYRPNDGNLEMTGDVILTQGPSVISGQRLVVDLGSGTGVMEGRVRSVFQGSDN